MWKPTMAGGRRRLPSPLPAWDSSGSRQPPTSASRRLGEQATMRIDSIEAIPIEIPLKKNFGGSTYTVLTRCTVITRMRTDAGLVSEVYNGDNRASGREIARLIRETLTPLVRGMNVFEGERIWETMFALTHMSRDRKVLLEAIACVDCAVWDLVGKALGKSVCALLGGYRKSLPIISIGGYYMEGKTLADIGLEMEAYRRAGMAGCKFKVGGLSPEEDARRVDAARRAAGADFVLAVDANRGWSVDDAVRFARLVERYDIRWFEEPCHWYDDAALMVRVRQATRIPITAGQSEITSHGVRPRQRRRLGMRRRHRMAPRRGPLRGRGPADGAPRGVADIPAPARRRAPRHLRRVLRRSRARSGLADDVGESARHQGPHDGGLHRSRLRPDPRRGPGRQIPRRLAAGG